MKVAKRLGGDYISLHIRRGDKLAPLWAKKEHCSSVQRQPDRIAAAVKCAIRHGTSAKRIVYFTDEKDPHWHNWLRGQLLKVAGATRIENGDEVIRSIATSKLMEEDNFWIYQVSARDVT